MREDTVAYLLYKNCLSSNSRVFFKLSHNLDVKTGRTWDYWTGADIDVIEISKDQTIIGYELKGYRKYKKNYEPPGLFDGLNQALHYLALPSVMEKGSKKEKFSGGIFDFVYLVHARQTAECYDLEKRVLGVTPIGFIIATPDGSFHRIHEAKQNPIQSKEAKEHFLENLDTLEQFSTNRKIFQEIKRIGEMYELSRRGLPG
jgi:hypothetical protein